MKVLRFTTGQQICSAAVQVLTVFMALDSIVFGRPASQSNFHTLFKKYQHKRLTNHVIVKRSAMENAKDTFQGFYGKLQSFIGEIPSKFKQDAPEALTNNIDALLFIIKPTDSSYGDNDVEDIIKREWLTIDITNLLLLKLGPFLSPSEKDWLMKEKYSLDLYITLVKISLGSLSLSHSDFEEIGAIGGINKGVYNTMDSTVLRGLKRLLAGLEH